MRRLIPYVIFGLTMFAIGLLLMTVFLSCEPTHPSAPARFVQEVIMPQHTVIYPIPRHGCGGLGLPADRETRTQEPARKGERV